MQEKLPAVFVEMAALVYALRPQSRFVLVVYRIEQVSNTLLISSLYFSGWGWTSARAFGALGHIKWFAERFFFQGPPRKCARGTSGVSSVPEC